MQVVVNIAFCFLVGGWYLSPRCAEGQREVSQPASTTPVSEQLVTPPSDWSPRPSTADSLR